MQTLSKWVLMVISLLWVTFSHAQRVVPVPALTAYQQECSVCHFAYPPGLLPPIHGETSPTPCPSTSPPTCCSTVTPKV